MDKKKSFTETLRTALENAPMSRYQISKDTGIDQASLSRFLTGNRAGLSVENLDILCEYLGLRLVRDKKGK